MSERAAVNTDRELFREDTGESAGSYYENSLHVTAEGTIGMNVGGTVYTLPIAKWHALIERVRVAEAKVAQCKALRPSGKIEWRNQGRSGEKDVVDYRDLRAALTTPTPDEGSAS